MENDEWLERFVLNILAHTCDDKLGRIRVTNIRVTYMCLKGKDGKVMLGGGALKIRGWGFISVA